MAEQQIPRPVSAGKYWRQFRVGDPSGTPLAEWAYFAPRFPEGIRQSALQNVAPEIQRETAFVWFNLNFEPYAIVGGPYFSFDRPGAGFDQAAWAPAFLDATAYASQPNAAAPYAGGGYGRGGYGRGPYGGSTTPPGEVPQVEGSGQAVYAPAPLDAAAVLHAEFGVILPDSVIAEVARNFSGQWMWRQRPAPRSIDPTGAPLDRAELNGAVLARLDALEAALLDLRPTPGEIGHNGPPEGFGLTQEDQREAEAAISRARTAITLEGQVSGAELQAAADALKPVGSKLRERALAMLNNLGPAFAKGVAQAAGLAFAKWLLAADHVHELVLLLQQAAHLGGHH